MSGCLKQLGLVFLLKLYGMVGSRAIVLSIITSLPNPPFCVYGNSVRWFFSDDSSGNFCWLNSLLSFVVDVQLKLQSWRLIILFVIMHNNASVLAVVVFSWNCTQYYRLLILLVKRIYVCSQPVADSKGGGRWGQSPSIGPFFKISRIFSYKRHIVCCVHL